MSSITYKKGDSSNPSTQTLIEQIAYTYDAAGRRTSRTTTNDHSHIETPIEATYDAANRMQTLTLKPGTPEEARFTLGYDANGNLTTKTQTYPASASATASTPNRNTTYTWDSRNRLTQLSVRPEPVEGSGGITASFRYDAQGRRIARTVTQNAGTANATTSTTHYIYEGQQALGELKSGSNNNDQFEPLLTGLQLDEVIARYTQNGAITCLTDALNTVMTQTSSTQDGLTQYGYSPYGESTVKSGTAEALGSTNSNTYTAREDDQTGLLFYRARYFDPVLGRFVSEDPVGVRESNNFYVGMKNSPLTLVDPTGRKTKGDGPKPPKGWWTSLLPSCGADYVPVDAGTRAAGLYSPVQNCGCYMDCYNEEVEICNDVISYAGPVAQYMCCTVKYFKCSAKCGKCCRGEGDCPPGPSKDKCD